VAVVSDHPDKAKSTAEKYHVSKERIYNYDNFDSIKDADDVDIVYIVLPNSQHCEFTIRAFNAGKHVLCEKPMADTVDDCKKMIETAKKVGKKLMIAYRLHYEPFNKKAMEIMRSGEMGKLRVFEANHSQTTEAPNIRLSKKLGGGPVEDVGIYCLNAARYISGEEPTEVSAVEVFPEGDERFREVPGHSTFQMKFPSGALAICACGFDSARSDRFRATCEKGFVQMDPAFGYAGLTLCSYLEEEKVKKEYKLEPKNHFTAEMDHFSKCVLENIEPKTGGEEGLKDIIVIEKIRESAKRGGEMIKIDAKH